VYLHLVALQEHGEDGDVQAAGEQYRYAVEWLRWVADAGDGALAWY
jgi:hypothetical protein